MAAADIYVLGLHSSHDSSACLLRNGEIVCGIEKERLTRAKHDWGRTGLRELADYCMAHAGIDASDIACVVVSEINNVTKEVIFTPGEHQISHHLAHAWAAVGLSGFTDCAVMILDGEGSRVAELASDERALADPPIDFYSEKESHYCYRDGRLAPVAKHTSGRGHESKFSGTDGVGSPYWYLSQLFFGREHQESKAMGLSAYGCARPEYGDIIRLADNGRTEIASDWIFELNLPPQASDLLYGEYADLAASVQAQLEAAIVHKARWLRGVTGSLNLCFAGGVALNCVANSVLANAGVFSSVFVPFGPGDSSVSIGCAYYGWHVTLGRERTPATRPSPFLGRAYTDREVLDAVEPFASSGLVHVGRPGPASDPVSDVVDCIVAGDVAAVYHGRSEFGPRALGNRSILADPRRREAREVMNHRVKFREAFRPFAAAVLEEHVAEWFEDVPRDADHMQYVARIRPDRAAQIPAVAHVDGSSRIQVVRRNADSILHDVVSAFFTATGVPIVMNTSFNVQEPIVETPFEALKTFVASRIDLLYLQGHVVRSRRVLLDTLPPDTDACTLVWHLDHELVANTCEGSFGLRPTSGREQSVYQGWSRTVSAYRESPICEDTFALLLRERPKRNDLLPMRGLSPFITAGVRADFEKVLLPARIASVVVRAAHA